MNRRQMLLSLAALAPLVAGCDKVSFLPQPRKKKAAGYDAVKNGMSEADVRKVMGEPSQRRGVNLEGTGQPALSMTYVNGGKLVTIMLVGNQVVGKQRY